MTIVYIFGVFSGTDTDTTLGIVAKRSKQLSKFQKKKNDEIIKVTLTEAV